MFSSYFIVSFRVPLTQWCRWRSKVYIYGRGPERGDCGRRVEGNGDRLGLNVVSEPMDALWAATKKRMSMSRYGIEHQSEEYQRKT